MVSFREVKVELIRPGPSHNQLLSPLTQYLALCGDGSPVTFRINLEHRKLLSRLARLRYVTAQGQGGAVAVPDRLREAEVVELGEEVANILAEMRTLNPELSRAQGETSARSNEGEREFVHLRLVLSGSELSLIPFEMAIAPQAFPGEGLEFCLQAKSPIVMTREIRRSGSIPMPWNGVGEPKVLFVSAAPDGMTVPSAAHIHALRAALEPWICWPQGNAEAERSQSKTEAERLELVKQRLRLLMNPSIEDIYEICSRDRFTHVHILAHGAAYQEAGELRFGLALCRRGNQQMQVVSGKKLAKALQAETADGAGRSRPLMVTLATCDSGNPGSVLVPGGSIAHDLHSEGIPWVIASQFPLTKVGSVLMTEELYRRFLRGDDPRQALFEVRRQLFRSSDHDHDWASVMAYAAMPDDLSSEVMLFFEQQMKSAIDVGLARADSSSDHESRKQALEGVERDLATWRHRLPIGTTVEERARRAECFGIHGATFKRMALLLQSDPQGKASNLKESLEYYRKSMDQWALAEERYHWTATQYLSLAAILKHGPDAGTFAVTYRLAERGLKSDAPSDKAWAHGSLAELEMLSLYHDSGKKHKVGQVKECVAYHCRAIVEIMGSQSFHVASTLRQFHRYRDDWQDDQKWGGIAECAIQTLDPKDEL